jgi:hypothetical protein
MRRFSTRSAPSKGPGVSLSTNSFLLAQCTEPTWSLIWTHIVTTLLILGVGYLLIKIGRR